MTDLTVNKPKVVVIAGPTASGKTGIAIELAKRFNGEVISADSRQVYKGMDIGTAKVTTEEMDGVPHHLLDVANPNDTYTAADFKKDGTKAIDDILSRNKLPIIAGGTFLYIDILLGKTELPNTPPNKALRTKLENKKTTELLTILEELDPERAANIDQENPRRLIRAIEVATALGKVPVNKTKESKYNTLTIALSVDMDSHRDTLRQRVIERVDDGMVSEVEELLESGVTHDRLEDLGLEYRYTSRYLRHLIDKDKLVEEITNKSRQYAKRQLTWLKSDDTIQWHKKDDTKIFTEVEKFLHN